jgi:hypothetical protein
MPSTSVPGDFNSASTDCMLDPPGPEQSWSMITLRFSCAKAGEAIRCIAAKAANVARAKSIRRVLFITGSYRLV